MYKSAKETILKLCIISILSCLPFLTTLRGDFVFDDSEAVVKNSDVTSNSLIDPFYNDFWGTNIKSNLSHKSYRPMTVFSFRLNYILSGQRLDPYHFKVTNLVCHSVCCVLVWYSLQALLTTFCRQKHSKHIDVAYWGTLLFAVHPVHVEAVCGIVGRADILSAITYFISFLLYHKATQSKFAKSCCYFLAAIVLATASMLFKENGVTVLGFCFMYELVNISMQGLHKTPYKKMLLCISIRGGSLIRLVLLSMSTVGLITARWQVMGGIRPEFKPTDNPAAFSKDLFERLATYNYIYVLNVLLLLWPQWLCFDWSMGCVPLLKKFQDPRITSVLLLYLYGIIVLHFMCNRKNKGRTKRITFMGLCLIIIPFLPASNIFFPVGFVIAERILYIPSVGYCLLIALGFERLLSIITGLAYKIIIVLFYVSILACYSIQSWDRSFHWQNEYQLFISGLSVCPLNAKVHYNVAKIADAKGQTEWALDEYKEAMRLYPEYYQAMNNFANLAKNRNDHSTAESYLKKAISLKKDFPAAWMNLGIVLANTKRYEEAQRAYETALVYRRNYPDCFYNLGNLFLEINKTDEAVVAWKEAIKLSPKHTLAWSNLLAFLDNSGQAEKGLKLFEKALQELPESPSINFVGANIFGKLNHYSEAEKYFTRAIHLFGERVQPVHYANLGVLYHRWQKPELAKEMYIKALKIDPKFVSARKNLKSLQKK